VFCLRENACCANFLVFSNLEEPLLDMIRRHPTVNLLGERCASLWHQPRFEGSNSLDRDSRNHIFPGKSGDALPAGSDGFDFVSFKECIRMLDPREVVPASLPHLVGHVVVVGPKPEMTLGIHAQPHVAMMQDLLIVGDRPARKDPCSPMGHLSLPVETTGPVSFPFLGTSPKPAPILTVLVDFAPKERGWIFPGLLVMRAVAGSRAVDGLSAWSIAKAARKLISAIRAVLDNLRFSHSSISSTGVVRIAGRGSRLAAVRSLLPVALAASLIFGVSSAEASSLWFAGNQAGERAALPQDVIQGSGLIAVEVIADDFGRDLAWLVGSHAADLYSTAWSIHRGAIEANPLVPDVESRLALKMASCATTGLTMWKLRRDGHGKAATVIRWLYVGVNAVIVTNNIYQGSRK
jgi:hypothetical protein